MAKITVNQTPSEQLVAAAVSEVVVKDEAGRSIKLKKPGVLSQFRLVKILGDSAKNEVYVRMVLPLTYVVEIDGDAIMQPNSEREIDALISRLDDAGVAAVMEGVQENFGSANADEVREEVKK